MTTPAAAPAGVEMSITTDGSLLCMLRHGPSGTGITTDAPLDNGGKGASFSPTDSVGAALGSCMLTTMALAAKRENVPWGLATAKVVKIMGGPPRRIAELKVDLVMPKELPEAQRAHFEEVAHGCPVARSLSTDTKVSLNVAYAE